jgi:hypothetical protein
LSANGLLDVGEAALMKVSVTLSLPPGFDPEHLTVGDRFTVQAAVSPQSAAGGPLGPWSSHDPSVATVDSAGNVTILKKGFAVIAARLDYDGPFSSYGGILITCDSSPGPVITKHPQELLVHNGSEYPSDRKYTLSVEASGTGTLHYQWQRGRGGVIGETWAWIPFRIRLVIMKYTQADIEIFIASSSLTTRGVRHRVVA